ncbi:MAG TPA: RagB/SusD family nutrient uptake outer membrane protein [Gemmatimonadaceae bacterium]|nr:RagB/SusD family nutrient uptake outer membrane protein [Gemmatimonadaceae bacterium]
MRPILRNGLAAMLLTAALGGCRFDITEYNPSGITAETVFTTPEGFETLVNAAYSYTRWWYGKEEGYNIAEMGTDLWMSGNGDVHPTLTSYQNLNATQTALTSLWEKFYTAINLVNAGVQGIDQSGLTGTRKSTRLAELRFLRAFYYWHLVETWGDVHFTLEPTTGIQTEANKTPAERIYQAIIEDLTFAVANLPTTQPDYGRITKGGAEAFLARVALTRGNNQEALTRATNVITGYAYRLLPNYADLWRMDNLKNAEVVWAVNYSTNTALNDRTNTVLFPNGHPRGGHNGHLMFGQLYDREPGMVRDIPNGRPFNRYMPTVFLLDLFDATADARFAASFRSVWRANSASRPAGMAIGDTAVFITKEVIPQAVQATKIYRIYDRSEVYRADGSPVTRGQYMDLAKFLDPTRTTIPEEVSGRDAFVIRLAEMYLIQAEAQLKLGNTAAAAQALNVLRTRAALPGRAAQMQVTPADVTLDFILDERARELAGEQLRWFDLKRTGKLVERVRLRNPDAAQFIQPYHVVRPIPQRQLDAVSNKGEFTQNPGYQ